MVDIFSSKLVSNIVAAVKHPLLWKPNKKPEQTTPESSQLENENPRKSEFAFTMGFFIHGRHAEIFGQIVEQVFVLGAENTILQFYWDGEVHFYSSTGTEKNQEKTV